MKTVLTVMCWLGVAIMLASCNGSSGSSGGGGDYSQVSFEKFGTEPNERVRCYNANSNTVTTVQICTWNCAYYESDTPSYVQLTFNYVCTKVNDDGDCEDEELALTNVVRGECRI